MNFIKYLSAFAFISVATISCSTSVPTANYIIKHKPNLQKAPSQPVKENDPYSDENNLDYYALNSKKKQQKKTQISSNEADKLISAAKTYLGTPYRFGGTTRSGIDCSSFIQRSFNDAGLDQMPRTSRQQAQKGESVSKSDLQKGDLIFFSNSPKSSISHVGIVERIEPAGTIYMIHAGSSTGVTVSSLSSAYWQKRYRYAKRMIHDDAISETPSYALN